MVVPTGSDYGRCPCSGTFEKRTVEVKMTVLGELIVLDSVPQGACPTCGSRVYKAAVLMAVEDIMRGQPTPGSDVSNG